MKLIKNENNHTHEENQELHRDLDQRVEEQPQPALRQRRAREISLHLRLIGPEVGKCDKKPTGKSRPERVTGVQPG